MKIQPTKDQVNKWIDEVVTANTGEDIPLAVVGKSTAWALEQVALMCDKQALSYKEGAGYNEACVIEDFAEEVRNATPPNPKDSACR